MIWADLERVAENKTKNQHRDVLEQAWTAGWVWCGQWGTLEDCLIKVLKTI